MFPQVHAPNLPLRSPCTTAHHSFFYLPLSIFLHGFAPTRSVPDGCPKLTASRSPPPAAKLTSVPGIAAAVPIATAAVPVMRIGVICPSTMHGPTNLCLQPESVCHLKIHNFLGQKQRQFLAYAHAFQASAIS